MTAIREIAIFAFSRRVVVLFLKNCAMFYALFFQVSQCARLGVALQLSCIALQDGDLVFQGLDLIVVVGLALPGRKRCRLVDAIFVSFCTPGTCWSKAIAL